MAAWILPAISLAANAVGSILGGSSASKAMKSAMRDTQQRMDENEDIYTRRYNEDATQRADAVRVMEMLNDTIRKRNKARAGSQAVMGGNEASVAAAKEADSRATAEAAAQIAANAEARKDKLEQNYLANKQNYENQLTNMKIGKAQNTAQAVQGVASAAGNALMNLGGGSGKASNSQLSALDQQRMINNAVAEQRIKDLAPKVTEITQQNQQAFYNQAMKNLGIG